MKRFITLLLLLSCFRFSYAEELTAEQQQLAWKFIYNLALSKSKDFHPIVFKEDIVINLKGKVTSEDSIVVKDIVKNFQKAIPHLKITLSSSPGNLILGLDFNKRTSITSNFNGFEINSRNEQVSLPDNLTSYQRKQFIYYRLCNGIVFFNYNKYLEDIFGMNGCVFAENDFDKISFSPFDLFILEKLYLPDFSIQLARNLSPGLQLTAWSSITDKFMAEVKEPFIYRTDIAIKLEGMVSPVDSALLDELIAELKLIIPNRKIYLTSEKANLIFNLLASDSAVSSSAIRMGSSIQIKQSNLFINPKTSKEDRKRTYYYNLRRSMVDFSPSQLGSTEITGCVFDEKVPESITFHPVDAFILNKLYADDFHEQFKNQYISRSSYRQYLVLLYHNELDSIFFLLALFIPSILLTWLMLKGAFKAHNWSWIEYNKQGLYLLAICSLYLVISSASDLQIYFKFSILLISFLQTLLAINLIFFIEKFILKYRNLGGSKIIVIFVVTFVVLTITSFLYRRQYEVSSEYFQKSIATNLPFLHIILFSLARSLYIFLNDRYKSIINQKDVELAQMGEYQRQAELDSLRAKINPHFLYNALNSIASLATTDARKTEQMALALSDFFKYAINREQKQLNTLAEELNAIRTYLEIEKVRFGDRLSFEIDCPEELLNIQIPQLLIQPLVENAIKHGLSQITENGLIRISVIRSENQLKIRVYDNGPAFPDGPLTGFGIQNTQERIALLYGPKATINWQNGVEKYIELCLPVVN